MIGQDLELLERPAPGICGCLLGCTAEEFSGFFNYFRRAILQFYLFVWKFLLSVFQYLLSE